MTRADRRWTGADPHNPGDRAFVQMSAEVDPALRSIAVWERQFER